MSEMMTTHEVAQYLRIKERKVYDLVRARRIPCTRVTGKWLFPRKPVALWIMQSAGLQGPEPALPRPPVIAGSDEPLLDWCVRESGCALALLTGGSLDGLARLGTGEAMACGLHVYDPDEDAYNLPAVRRSLPNRDLVMIEWAWREQGLVLAPGNPLAIQGISDLRDRRCRVLDRQPGAGAHLLLRHLLAEAGIATSEIALDTQPARSEQDVALAVIEGRADAGLAVRAVARQMRADCIALARERFDLVVFRRDYFELPFQTLLEFPRTPRFAAHAAEMGGYDVSRLGRVVYNAP